MFKPQIRDTEVQTQDVIDSGLDWVLVQPVHLTNGEEDSLPFASSDGTTGRLQVSRKSVARFMAEAVTSTAFLGQSVALSGRLRQPRDASH